MPLNINSIGTSGSGSKNGLSQLVAPSDVTPKNYGNIASYYISDYSNILPNSTSNFVKFTSIPKGLSRLIWFKDELYGIRILKTSRTSYGYTANVAISKLSLNGTVLSATDVYTYNFNGGYNYPYQSNIVIPGSNYLYLIEYKSISYDYNGNSSSEPAYVFSRFDGKSVEQINIMAANNSLVLNDDSWFANTGYTYSIDYFYMIDHQNEIFMIGKYKSIKLVNMSKSPIEVKDINTSNLTILETTSYLGRYSMVIGSVHTGYSSYKNVFLSGAFIIGNKGIVTYTTEDEYSNTSYCVGAFDVTIGESGITFSNITEVKHIDDPCPLLCASELGTCSLGYGTGYSLTAYVSYTDFFTMDPDTGNGIYYKVLHPSSAKTVLTISVDAGGSGIGCGTAIDRKSNRLYHINWLPGSGGAEYYYIGGGYEPVAIEYLSDTGESGPHSDISFNASKGDTIYCSSTITGYKLKDSSSYITTNSKKIKIMLDGSVIVTSAHNTSGYKSTWIILDTYGNIKYINYRVDSTTSIHGFFISGMKINKVVITTDGEQDVTLPDITSTGIYIDMKGV